MGTKDFIHTLAAGLLAATLCLPLATACSDDEPLEDGTENTDPSDDPNGNEDDPNGNGDNTEGEHDNGNGITYNDEDLTFDEAANLYTIHTTRGLWAWGLMNYGFPTTSAVLAADIKMGEYLPERYTEDNNWWAQTDLMGDITFDGAGHTISGMRIENSYSAQSLFRCVAEGAKVTNLTVEGDIRYTGSDRRTYAGGIASECNGGLITNCTFRGTIDGGAVDATGYSQTDLTMVGGIAGYAHNSSTISGCSAQGTFTAGGSYSVVGGIVGQVSQESLSQTVKDCHTPADCHVTGDMAGGIAGYVYMAWIRDCSSEAEVTGLSEAGGIIGYLDYQGATGCYTTSACRVNAPRYAGGLVGWLSSGYLFGCYSQAEVTGTESGSRAGYAGGLAGFGDGGYLIGCYFAGTAQAPERAMPFIGYQNYSVDDTRGSYSSGRILTGGTEDTSLANVYHGRQGTQQVGLDADGQPDWATATAELNAAITAYNSSNTRDCEYHFVQTDGTSNPPTLAEGAPGVE